MLPTPLLIAFTLALTALSPIMTSHYTFTAFFALAAVLSLALTTLLSFARMVAPGAAFSLAVSPDVFRFSGRISSLLLINVKKKNVHAFVSSYGCPSSKGVIRRALYESRASAEAEGVHDGRLHRD